jgi:mannose-6-phosphate isomerase-like protein (cupin superfamily)
MPARKDLTLILLTALATSSIVLLGQGAATRPGRPSVMPSAALNWNSIDAKPNANGSSKKFFEGPSPTLDLLECHATTLNPGASNHEILKRPTDEVQIVKDGTIEAYVGDKWVTLGPGSVIFNAAGADQAIRNTSAAPATYHVITFRPPAAAKPAN